MNRQERWRASPGQMNIWFEEAKGLGGRSNNNVALLKVEGAIPGGALIAGLDEILTAQPALHLRFEEIDGILHQIRSEVASPGILSRDYTDLSPDLAVRKALLTARSVADTPLDPRRGELFRAAVLRATPELHFVVLAISMLVSDGASMAVLHREFLLKLQGGAAQIERKDALPALRTASVVDPAQFEASLRFWQERMEERSLKYPWPVAEPFGTAGWSDGFIERLELSPEVSHALDDLARRRGSTRYAVVAAATAVVLQRIMGWPEVPFVLPMDGRNSTNIGLVGHFLRVTPCVIPIDPDRSFEAAVDAATQALLESSRHQWADLSKVLGALPTTGSPDAGVSVMITQNNAPIDTVRIGAISVTPLRFNNHSSKFDLSVLVNMSGPVALEVTFRKSLFAPDFARSCIAQIGHVLRQAGTGPQHPPGAVPVQDPAIPLALEDNERPKDAPRLLLSDLIARAAADHPDAVALAVRATTVSYRELQARIARARANLARHGPRPGEAILVAAGRGVASYVGFLAVLSGGWIATPFDPSWPRARQDLVRETVGARLVCGDVKALSEHPGLEMVDLEVPTGEEAPPPSSPVGLDDPAYIIFTSGTSGRPKAVVGTHRALANLAATATEFGLGPGRRIGQYASLYIDAALWDLCATLSSGASLIVLSDQSRLSPAALQTTIERKRLDLIKIPPSILAAFDPNGPVAKTTIVAGEDCPLSLWKTWAHRTELFNAYGPTEAGVWASLERLRVGERLLITVGRSIRGVAISVRDPVGRLLPRGASGRVWIAGQGLAIGYRNELEQTGQDYRSLADSAQAPRRWYRTDDRGRMLPDGRLQLAGRLDRMFKLHGQRIHPEEVEGHVRDASTAVTRAVVFGVPAERPEKMVAVVETAERRDTDLKSSIRSHLRRVLPPELANLAVTVVDDWPRTPGGKTDMAALRRLAGASPGDDLEKSRPDEGDGTFFYRLSYVLDGHLRLQVQPRRSWLFVGPDRELLRRLESTVARQGVPTEIPPYRELTDLDAAAFGTAAGDPPRQVVLALDLLRSGRAGEELLRSLHDGLTSLARALCATAQAATELWILVNGLFRIDPDEPLLPEARLPLAWLKAVAVELPELCVKLLDFGPHDRCPATDDAWETALGGLIGLPTGSVRAFRSGAIYSRRLSPLAVPETEAEAPADTAALFFGGGDIAHAFACQIARPRLTVVFASRSAGSPERRDVEIERAAELKRLGVEARFARCDLRDVQDVARAMRSFAGAFGKPSLIGHFAAEAAGKSVLTTTADEILNQYRTKAEGLSTILSLVAEHCPQPRVFALSSSATFSGGFGSYAYGFGNMALDAVAEGAKGAVQVIATGRWRGIGMASRLASSGRVSDEFAETLAKGFGRDDGCAALKTVLNMREPLTFASAHPLPLSEPNGYFLADFGSAAGILARAPKRARLLDASEAYIAPRTPLEAWLARRFEDCLDVTPVGIRDDFFALGGNSLNAANLAGMLSEDFGTQIGLAAIFRASDVEQLVRVLTEDPERSESVQQLAAALLHLSSLPDEVVKRLEHEKGLLQ